jgi:hypothetical protein
VLIKLGKGEGGPGKRLVCAGSLCPGPADICKTGQPPDNLVVVKDLNNGNQRRIVHCCQTQTPEDGPAFASLVVGSVSPLPDVEDFERGGYALPAGFLKRICPAW